jgi:hypothetical protein
MIYLIKTITKTVIDTIICAEYFFSDKFKSTSIYFMEIKKFNYYSNQQSLDLGRKMNNEAILLLWCIFVMYIIYYC